MFKIRNSLALTAIIVALAGASFAQTTRTARTSARQASLSDLDISRGLRAALGQGVRNAVSDLGRRNGFLDNSRVRIPLPRNLQRTERTLRALGQGRRVDEFVAAMNHAAEEAVPVAADIFFDAIMQMSFSDARNILFSGQDDAATQFFRRTSEQRLREEFRPIVERFTEQVGVTQKYKQLMGRYGFLGRAVGQDASDIDGYVTEKALDGLFLLVADEERRIRRDPIGRTTAILRTVFGVLR
ncbi:MAG: DUF4197 domain-containing protein [Pyrinomonadaceae bacterium]